VVIRGLDISASLATALLAAFRGGTPDPLTLDLLRSDLSHESAAKIARLVAIRAEWERGRYRPDDPKDIDRILGELQRIALRHARLASLRLGEFLLLAATLAALRAVRRTVGPVARGRVLSQRSLRRLEQDIDRLRHRFQTLVASLSDHFGARVRDLIRQATDEIRRDSADALRPEGVDIVLEDTGRGAGAWIPAAERAFWADLLRNVIRNAVEASREEPRSGGGRRVVTVRVQPTRDGSGTLLEVVDRGVGMNAGEAAGIWTAGVGRHGPRRGHGLTESKRAFAEARASIEVQSARGAGTTFAIAFPFRDVRIPAVPVYRVRPALVMALGLIVVGVLLASSQRRPQLVSVSLPTPTSIRAVDERGHAWVRELGEAVMGNTAATEIRPIELSRRLCAHLIVRDARDRALGVVVGTMPGDGPGSAWFLAPDGRVRWTRRLRWAVPVDQDLGNLKPAWEQSVPWPGEDRLAIAVNLRDSDHTCTSTQFFTLNGDSLGAYYHYGHLNFRAAGDLDRDGRIEVLLFGINNYASEDPTFLPTPQSAYIECLVLLEVPNVNGQSYPYTGWAGMPRASEEAYLLFPPLEVGERPHVIRIDIGVIGHDGVSCIEVALEDGRIYHMDKQLRPFLCRVGDGTAAVARVGGRPVAPLAYFHDGEREAIDLVVER
jgi:signal transduction histidine kinase